MAFNIVTYKIHEIAYISPFNKSNYLLLKYKIYQYYKNKFPSVYSVNELLSCITDGFTNLKEAFGGLFNWEENNMLDDIKIAFNGDSISTGWESVKSYFYKSSNGLCDLDITVLNEWFISSKYNNVSLAYTNLYTTIII